MGSGRRIFVGDIQGCRAELERLLGELRFDPAADELHPVGDFVNRGPDSLGVLRLTRELGAGGVLGNHDLHCLEQHLGRRKAGGRDTLAELLAAPDADELVAWLVARPFVRTWDDLILVHAGLHPKWDDPGAILANVDPREPSDAARFAVSVRTCGPAGELPPDGDPSQGGPFAPWFRYYRPEAHGGRTVVFGHWAVRGLVREPCLRGLDTGCVWGGRLTAWVAEEDRLVYVPAQRTYAQP